MFSSRAPTRDYAMASRGSASSLWAMNLLSSTCIVFTALSVFSCSTQARDNPDREIIRVRDRLYVWTHPAGSHDGYYLAPHTHVQSRMTPVEGALYLGVPNIYFIQYQDDSPPLSEFRKYAISFRPMKEVIWSLTGVAGRTSEDVRDHVLEIAEEFPNVSGFVLDDFIHWGEMRAHERIPHWVAENEVSFPVTLTLIPGEPTACEKLELVQTQWPTGDYRTKDFVVTVTENGRERRISKGILPNVASAVAAIELSGGKLEKLRIEILSTHDTDKAKSCGLQEVRLWNDGQKIHTAGSWSAEASSTYPTSAHAPEFVYLTEWPERPSSIEPEDPLALVAAAMSPEDLCALRDRTVINGKRLPIICGIYENQISPRIMPYLDQVDKVALWTWVAADLVNLEDNFEKLEKLIAPKPLILGCYMYDYGGTRPISAEQMKYQCELGLQWLKDGRIDGIIFLASNICDQELDAVEWTRKWIESVGNDPLQEP